MCALADDQICVSREGSREIQVGSLHISGEQHRFSLRLQAVGEGAFGVLGGDCRDLQNAVVVETAFRHLAVIQSPCSMAGKGDPIRDDVLPGQQGEIDGGVCSGVIPADEIRKMDQPVGVITVHMGDEDALHRFHGDAAVGKVTDGHDSHIHKVDPLAHRDHGAGASSMGFGNAVAGTQKGYLHAFFLRAKRMATPATIAAATTPRMIQRVALPSSVAAGVLS